MQIPHITPLRVRYHLQRLLCLRRCVHTLHPGGASANKVIVENRGDPPDICPLPASHDSSTIPPSSNSFAVSAPRTLPSILPVGLQYELRTGSSFFAKRLARPFPPPFNSAAPPASSPMCRDAFRNFHFNRSLSRKGDVDGAEGRTSMPFAPTQEDAHGLLRGVTNGDDAIVTSPYYIGVADGVGAWNTRPQGHAAVWSRLILHFWALETEQQVLRFNSSNYQTLTEGNSLLSPISALQASYETTTAITKPFPFLGTTTACIALLVPPTTLLLTNVGDSQAFVFRPSEGKFIARTEEQWHWFDCPRQLGTNSPDTPEGVGKVVDVQVEEGDLVLVATDGLVDNLWEAEIVRELTQWVATGEDEKQMAEKLVNKAKSVAGDPWGLSPYMERAVEQGLGIEGGKWDDISVVIARCQRRPEDD